MGWSTRKQIDDGRSRVLALTPEERAALTWEQAGKMVLLDTIALARWSGLKGSGEWTPWEALAKVWLIDTAEMSAP